MRAKNEGTVWRNKKTGKWWAQLPRDPVTGRRPKRSANSQEEALQKLEELKAERRQGIDPGEKRPTVANWLRLWKADIAGPGVEPTTRRNYEANIRLLIGALGERIKLDELTPALCRRALNSLALRQVGERSQPRSAAALGELRRVLRAALKAAVTDRLIAFNPADDVKLPKGAPPPEITPLTDGEARRLLAVAETRHNGLAIRLALQLGMRRGEVLGLRWTDIDYTAATLTIRGQVRCIPDETGTQRATLSTSTKTGKSRTLPLTVDLVARLRAHFAEQARLRQAMGADWKEHGLIFPSMYGNPRAPQNLNVQLTSISEEAGLRHINPHLLRHTCASWLAENGFSEAAIEAVLGHDKPRNNVTRRYIHLPLSTLRAALETVEARLKEAA